MHACIDCFFQNVQVSNKLYEVMGQFSINLNPPVPQS